MHLWCELMDLTWRIIFTQELWQILLLFCSHNLETRSRSQTIKLHQGMWDVHLWCRNIWRLNLKALKNYGRFSSWSYFCFCDLETTCTNVVNVFQTWLKTCSRCICGANMVALAQICEELSYTQELWLVLPLFLDVALKLHVHIGQVRTIKVHWDL